MPRQKQDSIHDSVKDDLLVPTRSNYSFGFTKHLNMADGLHWTASW